MKCDKCGEETYIIFITENHEKLCDNCWSKIIKKSEWKITKEKNEKYK
jgi:DNA-directed RNA polymerase subunit RPC12/RpoP